MSAPVLLVLGLAASVALAILAKRVALPYPLVFVVAGTLIGFIPGLPEVRIAPDFIFLLVLPPLLFAGGWSTDWVLFRMNLRPILQLAIGLVVASTVAVAALAHEIFPGMSWAVAFVLGAIVSPPDAVAAVATFERFRVPRRIVAIVDGEGLVNDATALVIYGFAVAAVASGKFSLPAAAGSFIVVAVGGIVVGIAVAWLSEELTRALARRGLSDSLIDNLTLIGTPYAAYVTGQALHVSAVLAVVVAGITLSRRSSVIYGPESRLIATNVWSLWIFLINAYVFLTIGLQLRGFVEHRERTFALIPAALAISVLLIVLRLVWVCVTAVLARLIPAVRRGDPMPPLGTILVIGWTGMRGIISLAAAFALPYSFAHREAIVFITFVVIFVTLVGQGLTLGPALKLLNVAEDGDGGAREIAVRVQALRAGLKRIAQLEWEDHDDEERDVLRRLRDEYEHRIEHLEHFGSGGVAPETHESTFDHRAQNEAIRAERAEIMRLRDRGEIPDEIFRKVQYDLDLASSRLY